ncbi:MAG: TlpA family protein disulfide reductase, partial [Micromonosporaceae bacterium]
CRDDRAGGRRRDARIRELIMRIVGVLLGTVMATVVTAVLAGCGASPEPRDAPSDADAAAWFEPCPAPAASAPAPAASTPAAPAASRDAASREPAGTTAAGAAGEVLPALTLPCLGKGEPVDLRIAPGVPTVVNVWASWCRPCRDELPAFQSYADRAGGRVRVLGVVSGDTRAAATSLAKDLKINFPAVFDPDGALVKQLGRQALPVTLFVAADGRLVHVHQGKPLNEAGLATLVEAQLGVRL